MFLLVLVAGCNLGHEKKLNKRVTLWKNDKIPYGTYYAYQNLHYLFPEAEMINAGNDASSKSLSNYWWKINSNKGNVALIAITPRVDPTDEEINTVFNLINEGDQVFISAFSFSKKFLDSFSVRDGQYGLFGFNDTLVASVYRPATGEEDTFEYPGYAYNNYFNTFDTNYVRILGRNKNGKANFIKINYKNGGSLLLHLEPFAFTNFFLLHKNNKEYYDDSFSYLPENIKVLVWGDFFRNNDNDFSPLQFLLSNPSFRWAFWLLFLLFLIIYVFESKRRQQMIPDIAPLRNSSLDFVKTVGRLYYQQRNNLDLAHKMTAHFLSNVRARYSLPTSNLDKNFVEQLSYKSGLKKDLAADLVELIKMIQQKQSLSDEELIGFNQKVEEFYKQT